jgi:signal transduction histidine kinase
MKDPKTQRSAGPWSIEAERARIAQDLHDGVGQVLTALKFSAHGLVRRLGGGSTPEGLAACRIEETVLRAIVEVRNVIWQLDPVPRRPSGLSESLAALASDTGAATGVPCIFDPRGAVEVANHDVATHLYRIGQEAVSNAIKHAQASLVRITLESNGHGLLLRVRDDGIGLPPLAGSRTKGVDGMRHRARTTGGSLHISSRPGRGTTVTVRGVRS